jgi:hypothetical protein
VALRGPLAATARGVGPRCLKRSCAGLPALREHKAIAVGVAEDRLRPAWQLCGRRVEGDAPRGELFVGCVDIASGEHGCRALGATSTQRILSPQPASSLSSKPRAST